MIRTPFELNDYPWQGPFDPTSDDLWLQSQRGQITEREYWQRRTASLYPDDADPTFTFMRTLYEQPEGAIVRPEVVGLIDDLRAGQVRVAALSNDLAAFHPPEWIRRMTIMARFDPLIDLSHTGVLKPEPAAFRYALDQLGVDGTEVVLLDDQVPNVEGAREAGLGAVWFDVTDVPGSVTRMRAELAA